MTLRVLALAQQELDDAVEWYNGQATGLGQEFLDDVDRAIRRTVSFPMSAPEIDSGVHRCLLTRFPYGLIYGIDRNTIVLLAVAHLHRHPRYWMDRR